MRAAYLLLLALSMPGGASVAVLLADAPDSSLQSFLDADVDTLVIAAKPGGWSTGPLWMRNSGRTLILRPGTVIRARADAFPGRGDCLLTLGDVRDVTVLGYGARLVMRKDEYRDGEWRHAVSIRGSRGITVEGLAIDSSGGDGIYIDGWWKNRSDHSVDIAIRHVRLRGHRRQGISVISAKNLLIEHVVAEGTSGTDPEAGIDFEPDSPRHRLVNVRVRNSVFRDNAGPPVMVYLNKFSVETLPVSLEFEDCLFSRSQGRQTSRVAAFPEGLRGDVKFSRSVFRSQGGAALKIDNKAKASASLSLHKVTIERDPHVSTGSITTLRFEGRRHQSRFWPIGGIRGEDLMFGPGVRFEFGGRDTVWTPGLREVRLSAFADSGLEASAEVDFERLHRRPSWSPPPPLMDFIPARNGGIEVRVWNWAKDPVRIRMEGGAWHKSSHATRKHLRPGQVLSAYSVRNGSFSDTVTWRAPPFDLGR